MDDFNDGHSAGWEAGIAEAERRCVKVWVGNQEVYAVPWTELVQIRGLVGQAKKAVE